MNYMCLHSSKQYLPFYCTAPDDKLLNISCETSAYQESETSTHKVSETTESSAKPTALVTKEAFASDSDDESDTIITGKIKF